MRRKILGVEMLCPHCKKHFRAVFPTPPPIMYLDSDEKKPRPAIADGVEYDSYAHYLKSRKEKE